MQPFYTSPLGPKSREKGARPSFPSRIVAKNDGVKRERSSIKPKRPRERGFFPKMKRTLFHYYSVHNQNRESATSLRFTICGQNREVKKSAAFLHLSVCGQNRRLHLSVCEQKREGKRARPSFTSRFVAKPRVKSSAVFFHLSVCGQKPG